MSKTLSAIAKLLSVRRIPFLGLTGTGLDDFDGRMIAAAPDDAPHRVSTEQERLDLAQIDFISVIRARLLAAGDKDGVRVLLSNPDGRVTALRCAGPEGFTLRHAGTSVLIQDAT